MRYLLALDAFLRDSKSRTHEPTKMDTLTAYNAILNAAVNVVESLAKEQSDPDAFKRAVAARLAPQSPPDYPALFLFWDNVKRREVRIQVGRIEATGELRWWKPGRGDATRSLADDPPNGEWRGLAPLTRSNVP